MFGSSQSPLHSSLNDSYHSVSSSSSYNVVFFPFEILQYSSKVITGSLYLYPVDTSNQFSSAKTIRVRALSKLLTISSYYLSSAILIPIKDVNGF